jgi:hypothetical protein
MKTATAKIFSSCVLCLFACKKNEEIEQTKKSSQAKAQRSITRTSSSVTILSKVQTVDRIYPSMTGPYWTGQFQLLENEAPQLLWMHKIRSVIKQADGRRDASSQFMCHSNVDWEETPRIFAGSRPTPRMFTLSQGQLDLVLPTGFGIPIISNEKLRLATQILNLHEKTGSRQLRHETTIQFSSNVDSGARTKPLTYRTIAVKVSMTGESMVFHENQPTPLQRQARCLPGEDAAQGNVMEHDQHGRKFSGHWMVPPGRHVYRTLANRQMAINKDTRIHAIVSHLHPFAESLALRDLTTKKTVFKAVTKNFQNSIGLESVKSYSDAEGLALIHDHDYEVIATYNNTSNKKQDAMAVLYLYIFDHDFTHPRIGHKN